VYPSGDSSLEGWPRCSGPEVKIGHIHVVLTAIAVCLTPIGYREYYFFMKGDIDSELIRRESCAAEKAIYYP